MIKWRTQKGKTVKLVGIEKTKRKGKENTAMESNGIGKKNRNKCNSSAITNHFLMAGERKGK